MLKGHEKINHLKRAQGYLWRCSVITWLLIEAIQAKGTWGPNMMNSYINPGSKNGPVKWLACFLHCCSISGRWGHRSDMRWTKRGSQSGLSANDCLASNDAQSCTFTLSASFSLYSCCASALMCFSNIYHELLLNAVTLWTSTSWQNIFLCISASKCVGYV